ncbi:class I SAM-dependent methyltransferase [Acidithiobacillus thiooxidans]|uniref:C-methyltransferase NovU n=1 Tax=Acidithiobacillus thiooxidans ATCC 19377 TaxID=637390 RepID=A0A543Q7T8_ACITH|nr:class I SAM-dependent methyltransferase [Acidithiobacillus thiooxidans]MDR7927857.1 class I SAM-dependent methyltransferase [Acidithiobacillus thiooxidans]MDX5936110.1 class I SAM-dependent methyltransferase [Acidithiobacillus thiooxidans]TQN52385.1 C-methyltransferase NovU [Acidithiobacillus thiooxidans ATCC 19377]
MKCRNCGSELKLSLVDLGSAPPSNAYLTDQTLHAPEKWFPLRVLVCENCWLAQTEDFTQTDELFNTEYAYFSSYSKSWLAHSERYVAEMVERFNLTTNSHVVEIAANDGYLLQYVKARNIQCTGVEPTASTASAARTKGITIIEDFFGVRLAQVLVTQGKQADLAVANNVLAHVPNINDFVSGFIHLLKPNGVCTFEFPHLMRLIEGNQFDTIYHEHFSYLSLTVVDRIFSANGLSVFDVEELQTHGGSLRVFAQRSDTGPHIRSIRVSQLIDNEIQYGILCADYYSGFQAKADRVKNDFLTFLLEAKRQGKTVAAYGAAAKGNTLMNYAGIRSDLISFVVDRNPAKKGKFMPGSRIPIVDEERLKISKNDYVIIFPWNIKEEVMNQLSYIREWGGVFVLALPWLDAIA